MICHHLSVAIKICDIFSGKPLEGVIVTIEKLQIRFVEKGNGFYAVANLPTGCYVVSIVRKGYAKKEVFFDMEQGESMLTCFLMPTWQEKKDVVVIAGDIKKDKQPYCAQSFYYSMESMRYQGVITQPLKTGDKKINLHIAMEEGLEGRKFALKSFLQVYSIGSFDYVEKNYKLKQAAIQNNEKGDMVYLLLEQQTKEDGTFEIVFPKYLAEQRKIFLLFFVEGSCMKREIDIDAEFSYVSIVLEGGEE